MAQVEAMADAVNRRYRPMVIFPSSRASALACGEDRRRAGLGDTHRLYRHHHIGDGRDGTRMSGSNEPEWPLRTRSQVLEAALGP